MRILQLAALRGWDATAICQEAARLQQMMLDVGREAAFDRSRPGDGSDGTEYLESELRQMRPRVLKAILRREGLHNVAPEVVQDSDDPNEIVDWMMRIA